MPDTLIPTFSNLPQMPLNALTGAESGWNAAQAQNQQDMNLQDQQLNYQRIQNIYQNELLDNPMKAAQRALTMDTAKAEDVPYANGTMNQVTQADAEAKLQTHLAQKSTSQLTNMVNQSQFYQGVVSAMNDPTTGPADAAAVDGKWQQFKTIGKSLGIPDNMLPDHMTPEIMKAYQNAANVGIQTTPLIQKMLTIKAQTEGEKEVAAVKGTYGVAAAAAGAGAAWNRTVAGLPQDKQVVAEINAKVAQGQPIDVNDINRLVRATAMTIRSDPQVGSILTLANSQEKQDMVNDTQRQKDALAVGLPANADPAKIKEAYINQHIKELVMGSVFATVAGKPALSADGKTMGVYDEKGNFTPQGPAPTNGQTPAQSNIFNASGNVTNAQTGGAATNLNKTIGNVAKAAAKATTPSAPDQPENPEAAISDSGSEIFTGSPDHGATGSWGASKSTKIDPMKAIVEAHGATYNPNMEYKMINGNLKMRPKK